MASISQWRSSAHAVSQSAATLRSLARWAVGEPPHRVRACVSCGQAAFEVHAFIDSDLVLEIPFTHTYNSETGENSFKYDVRIQRGQIELTVDAAAPAP